MSQLRNQVEAAAGVEAAAEITRAATIATEAEAQAAEVTNTARATGAWKLIEAGAGALADVEEAGTEAGEAGAVADIVEAGPEAGVAAGAKAEAEPGAGEAVGARKTSIKPAKTVAETTLLASETRSLVRNIPSTADHLVWTKMKRLAGTADATGNQAKTAYAPNALQHFAACATNRMWKEQTRGLYV